MKIEIKNRLVCTILFSLFFVNILIFGTQISCFFDRYDINIALIYALGNMMAIYVPIGFAVILLYDRKSTSIHEQDKEKMI
ncbi:hypothetical protein GMA11_06255 [Granulicatella sp. zg-ZJ]|uniref:hypothetical protein n=1 Tax=Granulicatella sp. zg-ZJ TaxID=2678504 RepID=UPI0013D0AD54|nr:hypothetical protein [Granulicatella sp. zg-ZJ]NEW62448.1 hypothetical protein [Granulicatella sp. zg-ZJ]NEW62994.1 hypothetical protein [Granulicatella sp. zg-ZJ]